MWLNDISDLVERLKKRDARTVALQFPEGLKRRSAEMVAALKDAGFEVILSGDPCYGACDLALESLGHSDVLVHFGHAPVDEQPQVIFEPWDISFDVAVLEHALPLLTGRTVGLVTTIQHTSLIPAMEAYLRSHNITAFVAEGSGRTRFAVRCSGAVLPRHVRAVLTRSFLWAPGSFTPPALPSQPGPG